MINCVLNRSTAILFLPRGCSETGRLYGWTRIQLEPLSITSVVLGVLPDGLSEEAVLHRCLPREATGPHGGQLGVVGRLSDEITTEEMSEGHQLWIGCEIDKNKLPKLKTFKLQCQDSENLNIKVFYYHPPQYGKSHFPMLGSFSCESTVFTFAVEAMNTAPWIQHCVAKHSPCRLPLHNTWLMNSSPEHQRYVPFATGRLVSLWLSQWTSHGVKVEFCNAVSVNKAILQTRHAFISHIVELVLAFICIYYLLFYKSLILGQISVWAVDLNRLLMEDAKWLSGNPAGIKLHRPLASFYASSLETTATQMLILHQHLLKIVHKAFYLILLLCSFGGMSLVLALVWDLIYIAAFPITILYTILSVGLSLHKTALVLTWRLLRGVYAQEKRKRKRKPSLQQDHLFGRDKRAKDDEVLMEHLIVGVLLFTPLLALIPTIFLFFGFVLCVHSITLVLRGLIICLISLAKKNPVIFWLLRLLYPGLFPSMVYIDFLEDSQILDINCIYYALEVIPSNSITLPKFEFCKLPLWITLPWPLNVYFLGLQP